MPYANYESKLAREKARYHQLMIDDPKSTRAKALIRVKRYQAKRDPADVKLYNRKAKLKREYGLTLEDFDKRSEKQSGLCAVCGRLPGAVGLVIDHDHETGVVRDLLCGKCNSVLGFVNDNPIILRQAIAYLERHALPKT